MTPARRVWRLLKLPDQIPLGFAALGNGALMGTMILIVCALHGCMAPAAGDGLDVVPAPPAGGCAAIAPADGRTGDLWRCAYDGRAYLFTGRQWMIARNLEGINHD